MQKLLYLHKRLQIYNQFLKSQNISVPIHTQSHSMLKYVSYLHLSIFLFVSLTLQLDVNILVVPPYPEMHLLLSTVLTLSPPPPPQQHDCVCTARSSKEAEEEEEDSSAAYAVAVLERTTVQILEVIVYYIVDDIWTESKKVWKSLEAWHPYQASWKCAIGSKLIMGRWTNISSVSLLYSFSFSTVTLWIKHITSFMQRTSRTETFYFVAERVSLYRGPS